MLFMFHITDIFESHNGHANIGGFFEIGSIPFNGTTALVENASPPRTITIISRAIVNRRDGKDPRYELLSIESPSFDVSELRGATLKGHHFA